MRILFVTSNRVGDAVLSTGLLDRLIRAHPDARITVVCGRVAEGVFARMPNRERTIILDKRPYGLHWLPLWASTVRTVWDLVVDSRLRAVLPHPDQAAGGLATPARPQDRRTGRGPEP
jgi:heptosyltransferase-3